MFGSKARKPLQIVRLGVFARGMHRLGALGQKPQLMVTTITLPDRLCELTRYIGAVYEKSVPECWPSLCKPEEVCLSCSTTDTIPPKVAISQHREIRAREVR